MNDFETVALTGETSNFAVLYQTRFIGDLSNFTVALTGETVPDKMIDLSNFTVSCCIGDLDLRRAVCNLRASINLMSLSIFRQLGIGEVQPTHMAL
ncbi:uncharacterized protein E5676_scaffold436G001100 [Cucumis melo var. makuwa]|uniref:Uncharacterized protein n=1 Tax=Cucumis melo var. makuwa TaxID=1194695 RepID=A0A5D3DQX2_CUCMM|nr:uncharacterized protein E5676_scaffold436G001100 [Cucumis melo var. makuwa]